MEPYINPIVTSKMADKHYDDILSRYQEIEDGMIQQAERVKLYNQQQQAEQANRRSQDIQMEKERMANEVKNRELELKRLALTSS
jgi:hypothetical protein